jgi:AraC-like DNA-binding protein
VVVDEYVVARPGAVLAPFVGQYSGYRQRGVAPMRHLGLPSPWLTMILTMEEPLVVAAHPDPRQRPGSFDALVGGLHLAPAVITHDGWQSGIQVALRPLGCRAVLGLPAAELAGLDVDAAAVLGESTVAEIRERLVAAPDWPSRFAVVDAVLGRRITGRAPSSETGRTPGATRSADGLRAADGARGLGNGAAGVDVAPEVAYAWGRILRGVAIRTVAAEVGWSDRHLTARFRAEVGLRPKEAARVARFDRARRALRPDVRIAEVAAAHGFADQSHLVREFRALAGCTPSEWLAEEFGFVQALVLASAQDGIHD